MRIITRPFVLLVTLGWVVFWASTLFLMWRPEYQATLDFPNFSGVADITTSGLARIVATLISLAAVAAALPVLLAVFLPAGAGVAERPRDIMLPLRDELASLRARVDRQDEELRQLRDLIHQHETERVHQRTA